jgi:hypothetical protein
MLLCWGLYYSTCAYIVKNVTKRIIDHPRRHINAIPRITDTATTSVTSVFSVFIFIDLFVREFINNPIVAFSFTVGKVF